jgi:signal peptidase
VSRGLSVRAAELAGAVAVLVALALPLAFTWTPVRVNGGSMEPTLFAGDLAVVRRGASADAGDVVLFDTARHGRVIHRVERRLPDGSIVTRGDANPVADFDPVAPNQVRGRVVAVLPVGRVVRGLRGP